MTQGSTGVREGTGWLRLAVCALAMLAGAASAADAIADATRPCRVAGLATEVRCGVLKRPLDAARPDGTQLDIHFMVVPAIARRRLPDPVFLLAGGPGQSAIELAPSVLPLLARLNNRRDLVFVDQRGTGRSAPLACDEPRHPPLAETGDSAAQLLRLRRCLATLSSTAPLTSADDLRFFTTPLAMQDLDAVRDRLGAPRINLIGASYGTRAALDYARQFPDRLRRSVLDGVAPPDMVLPLSGGIDSQAAFDAMLADCERTPACARRHPALRADWAALLASLPKTVTAVHPFTGRLETFALDRDRLLGAVRGPLYAPVLAAALPEVIGEAARGRFEPLLGLSSLLSGRRGSGVATGMHFSVLCAEDGPRMGPASEPVDPTAAPFVEQAAAVYREACAFWPRGSVHEAFYHPSPAASAVLLLSGGLDPATPPRHGERLARALGPKARHVVVPNAGHGLMGIGCVRDVMHRFIDAADDARALGVDAACLDGLPRPPAFEPVAPADTASSGAGGLR